MHFDVVLIGDFRVPGGTSRQASNQIRVLHRAGYSVGLISVELPHAKGRKPVDSLIRARISLGEATIIREGFEDLSASLVVFENPRAFQEPPAEALKIDARRAIIAVHFPLIDGTGAQTFDPAQVAQICAQITDAPLAWAPVSNLTRRLLKTSTADLPILERNLPNIVMLDDFRVERTSPVKSVPVIGRHSRPQPDKWPPSRREMLQVYPRDPGIEVALLGVGNELRQLVGNYPRNWRTYEFNEIAPVDFLRGIDFFVYFHHPDWVEAFGIATAEAMASGAVAILPPYMKENFGNAAVYCEPKAALATVRALYSDWRAYQLQSRKGRDWVRKHQSPEAYLAVVEPLIGSHRRRKQTLKRRAAVRTFDVAILADMSRSGSPALRIAGEVHALAEGGYKTVLMHLPQGSMAGRVRPEIDRLVQRSLAEVGDPWSADARSALLVVHGPQSLIANLANPRLTVSARQVVIVVDGPFIGSERISLADRLLRAAGASSVTWAPTNDYVRMWLEDVAPEVGIAAANWRPITAHRAHGPRTVQRRKPVAVVVELTPGETGTGEMRRAMAALPRDGSISIRLHGAPDESALKQYLPLTGWELFKNFQMELCKVLDGADFLLCLGGEQRGTIPDVAAAEAAARGLPVIASPALRRHFGDGAIYSPAAAMTAVIKQLHGSSRQYAAASRAALTRAARIHSAEIHRQRVATLLGSSAAPKASRRKGDATKRKSVPLPVIASAPRRIMMFSQNGVGLGHVVRQLAISRHLSKHHDIVFCSMSQAYDVIDAYGYQVEHLPSHVYTGVEYIDWHPWARDQVERMIDFYDVGAVVLDGSVPYLGLLDAVSPRPDVRHVWIRRPMWRPTQESLLRIAQQRFFDLIIEPAELAGEVEQGPTVAHRDRCVCVDPIRLLEERELLTRRQAAAVLKLDPERPAALIQLGSGANRDIVGLTDRILEASKKFDGLQVVIAEWLNSAEALDLWDDVACLSGFPISRYFRAFDFSVSAAGYNSFHEVLSYGLPTIFIGNTRKYMDDQGARADYAAKHGAAAVSGSAPREIAAALARFMDAEQRCAMAQAARRLSRPNGARAAADAIRRLMES
jgi:UDP:flavonoid glycosyltransferase YjiC (YdhE family)/glycosyltransferase involved in cell wall biosynthesis